MATTRKPKMSHSEFIRVISDLVGDEYSVLSEYISTRVPVKMKHTKCGYEWDCNSREFRKGTRCPKCSGLLKKTHEQFLAEVQVSGNGEYEVLSKYQNGHAKVLFKHLSDRCNNNEFEKTPNKFLIRNQHCPVCSSLEIESKNVRVIKEFLESKNIAYETEVSFEDCKNINYLPFDFYIEEMNLLIEYDGEQHFRAWYDDNERLLKQQSNDKIKTDWAASYGITLLRINYKHKILNVLNTYFKGADVKPL